MMPTPKPNHHLKIEQFFSHENQINALIRSKCLGIPTRLWPLVIKTNAVKPLPVLVFCFGIGL